MTKIRIVAAVVDTRRLTLYKEDGTTIRIPQGDPRIQKILDDAKENLLANRVAEIEIGSKTSTTVYSDFEKSTGGLVRFFKVAKNKISNLFGGEIEEIAPMVPNTKLGTLGARVNSSSGKTDSALSQIMKHALPMEDDDLEESETAVAVVDNKPIPGVEKLHKQFAYANKMTSSKGMQAFLSRIAKVSEKRQHTVDELLTFLQKADLPIADDGSIVIYKILRWGPEKGNYVDCHTRKVVQQIGSYVCMDEKLVDPSRRLQCSTGLHVARRKYLGNFRGDVCTLGKVAPEDVIAVPHGEPDKMRVRGYHILFELSDDMFRALKQDSAMTGSKDGQQLLAKAITGNHEPPVEEVRITEPYGGKIVITPLKGNGEKVPVQKQAPRIRKATAIDVRDPKKELAPSVDPKAISKEISKAKAKSRAEMISGLLDTMAAEKISPNDRIEATKELLRIRAKAKKSWAGLGYPRITDDNLNNFIKSTQERVNRMAEKAQAKKAAKAEKSNGRSRPNGSGQTINERARQLFDGGDWASLEMFKSSKKKGWAALGFNASEIAKIERNI